MVRLTEKAAKGNGRRGEWPGSPGKAEKAKPVVPVTDGLVECPVCHGGVRVIVARFGEKSQGIMYGKTKLYGRHTWGGTMTSRKKLPCAGSEMKVEGQQ